jgi:hypothetical protein
MALTSCLFPVISHVSYVLQGVDRLPQKKKKKNCVVLLMKHGRYLTYKYMKARRISKLDSRRSLAEFRHTRGMFSENDIIVTVARVWSCLCSVQIVTGV